MEKKNYQALVISSKETKAGSGLFEVKLWWPNHPEFKPGQFVTLAPACPTSQARRPFTIYQHDDESITLLINVVGRNTKLYANLAPNNCIHIAGPKGAPTSYDKNAERYILVAGGAGVASVVPFAEQIRELDKNVEVYIGAFSQAQLAGVDYLTSLGCLVDTITDSGKGKTGFVTELLKVALKSKNDNTVVISCGPPGMLKKVAELTSDCHESWVLLEEYLLCGGNFDCKGCAIKGKDKSFLYLCIDGPAFSASWVDFDPLIERENVITVSSSDTEETVPENPLAVTLTGQDGRKLCLSKPFMIASGCKDCGSDAPDRDYIGAEITKGIKKEKTPGNEGPRVWEVPGGALNSIGLAGKGVELTIKEDFPVWKSSKLPLFANVSGSTVKEYVSVSCKCIEAGVDAIELNISCPNVEGAGMIFGVDPKLTHEVVAAVRKEIPNNIPIISKLTPGIGIFIADIAKAAVEAGSDMISLINTLSAIDYDIDTWLPRPGHGFAGLSGPPIFPHALWHVRQVCRALPKVPIIGVGGIHSGETAVKMFLVGASAIQVGTARFTNPNIIIEIHHFLLNYLKKYGFTSIDQIVGKAKKGKGEK